MVFNPLPTRAFVSVSRAIQTLDAPCNALAMVTTMPRLVSVFVTTCLAIGEPIAIFRAALATGIAAMSLALCMDRPAAAMAIATQPPPSARATLDGAELVAKRPIALVILIATTGDSVTSLPSHYHSVRTVFKAGWVLVAIFDAPMVRRCR